MKGKIMRKVSRVVAVFALLVTTSASVGTLALTQPALAQTPKDAACQGVALTGGNCNASDPNASAGEVNKILATVINIFSFIIGFAAVIMIMIGGFKYITSTGDSSSVNSAKDTILYAVIGLAIVAFAQVIVRFVLDKL